MERPRTLLVTTLRVERNEARAHLQEGFRVDVVDGVDYDVGSFVAGETTWEVGVAELGQDNIDAATEVERAVRWFEPHLVLFLGIAHPLNNAVPGDVVAGRSIEGYELDPDPPGFLQRGRVELAVPRLLHVADMVLQSPWFDRVRLVVPEEERASLPTEQPGVHIGAIAAGPKLSSRQRPDLRTFLETLEGDVLAVEPEGLGFLLGLYANAHRHSMVVRGICQTSDGLADISAQEQRLAARHAAGFGFELLARLQGVAALRGAAEPGSQVETRYSFQRTEIAPRSVGNLPRSGDIAEGRQERRTRFQSDQDAKPKISPAEFQNLVLSSPLGPTSRVWHPQETAAPDLVIKISLPTPMTLRFEIDSPSDKTGNWYTDAGQVELRRHPEEIQAEYVRRLENLALGKDGDGRKLQPDDVETILHNIGRELYQEVFPERLRTLYSQQRGNIDTIIITSEEPYIPWELAKPHEDGLNGGPSFEEDFLCVRHSMTRWLHQASRPRPAFSVERVVTINADRPRERVLGRSIRRPLLHAADECSTLVQLATSRGVVDLSPTRATYDAVVGLLDGEAGSVDLWHVVAHADAGKANANEWVVVLSDATHLRPDHFKRTKARSGLRKRRPLVFLNACSTSLQGWSITTLGGWAKTCVADCLCGAFVGPLWNVGDKLAAEFSRAFYEELSQNQTLGNAARRARERVRRKSGINPIWLAYSVYGHPNGRVFFGGTPTGPDGDPPP